MNWFELLTASKKPFVRLSPAEVERAWKEAVEFELRRAGGDRLLAIQRARRSNPELARAWAEVGHG